MIQFCVEMCGLRLIKYIQKNSKLLTFNVTDPKSYSRLYRSSTVARYLSLYVLNKNRFTMELLPTPAPPKITNRIRSKSAIFHWFLRRLYLLAIRMSGQKQNSVLMAFSNFFFIRAVCIEIIHDQLLTTYFSVIFFDFFFVRI